MARYTNTNVPSDRGPFVGRDQELSAIDEAFAGGVPLLTLLGAPGTGKTRLAVHYAASQREALCASGGVWFCDLTEAETADELAGVVAARLGIPLMSGAASDGGARLGFALERRGPLLLVLDNFEQLAPDAGDLVERWIRAAPQAMVLVTSQRRLGLADEQLLELGPLAAPAEGVVEPEKLEASPAVKLFVARARAVRADYQLTADNAPLVSALVRRLEGIPLGIELCAARIGVLGERQLLELFERRLDIPDAGRAASARHSTLQDAIAWSWGLLADWQRAALGQCSVFRSGFSLEAVEHVVDLTDMAGAPSGPLWADDVMRGLTGASLVRSEAHGEGGRRRYGLLESVRRFATEWLEQSGSAEAARGRHADHFAAVARAWAEGVDGPGGVGLRRRLALEQGNVLAAYEHELAQGSAARAIEILLALEPVFATRGPFGRYTSLLEASLARARAESAGLDPAIEARALASLGWLAILQGRLDDAVGDYTAALAAAERAGARDVAALAGVKVGLCHGLAGRSGEAEQWFSRAERALESSSVRIVRTYFNDLGLVRTQQGRVDEALACLSKALELHQRTGNRRDEGVTLGNIGGRLYEQGALADALDHYERAIEILREVGDRRSAGVMLAHVGQVEQELGRFESARQKLVEALAIQREVGDFAWEGIVEGMIGNIDLEEDRPRAAAEHFRQSVVTLTGSSYRRNAGLSLASLAIAEAACARAEAAQRALERARALLSEVGSPGDREACELLALAVDLQGTPNGSTRQRAEAAHAERSHSGAPLPDEVRFALRVLRATLDREAAPAGSSPPEPALVIGPRSMWFRRAGGQRVDLSRRGPLRRLLDALVERRTSEPGRGLGVPELAAAAWPETAETARGLSARVYVGIGTLRRLGLGSILTRGGDGYLLDPEVQLARSEAPHSEDGSDKF